VTVLAVNWTGILAVIAIIVAVVAIVVASVSVYGLVQIRRQTKVEQHPPTDDAKRDSR
jgi:heme/copper-type cytochrome/quinol oxidase subunit 2